MKRFIYFTLTCLLLCTINSEVTAQREWSKHLEFQGRNVSASRIAILADSSIVLATEAISSSRDIVVIKMNVKGDTLWSKRIDEGQDEYIGDVIAFQNTIYIVGSQVAQNNAFLVFQLDANGDSLDSRKVGIPVALQINDAYLSQNRIVAAGKAFVTAGQQPAIVTYDLTTRAFQNAAVGANGGSGEFNGIAQGANKEVIAVGHIDNDSAIVCRFDSALQLISTSMVNQLGGSFRDISPKSNGYIALLAADSSSRSNTISYVCHLDTSVSITSVEMHEGKGNLRANSIVNFKDQGYAIGGNLDSGTFSAPFIAFFFQSGDTLSKMMNNKVRSSTPTVLSMAYGNEFVAAVGNASVQAGQREGYSLFVKDSISSANCNPGIQKYWKNTTNVNIRLIQITASTISSFVFPSTANPRISNLSISLDTSICLLSSQPINFAPLSDSITHCGDSVILNAAAFGIQSYAWSNGSTSNEAVAKQTGWYVVTATDPVGNNYLDSTYVTLNSNPGILLDAMPSEICEGDTIELSATTSSNSIGQWRNSSSILNPLSLVTKAAPISSEWFVFTSTDTITGCSNTDSIFVSIRSIANPPYVLNGVARKKNGNPLNASQVYLLTYKNNQEAIIDTFKTGLDGKFSFTHNEPTVYLKVEPNIRLYQGQMITYYKSAESIDSAEAITYSGCTSKIGVGFRTLKGENLTQLKESAISTLSIKAIPNPSNGHFIISSSESLTGKINIRSIHGQVILSRAIEDSTSVEFDLGHRPGLYFAEIEQEGAVTTVITLIID